jgi:hypothetical protein
VLQVGSLGEGVVLQFMVKVPMLLGLVIVVEAMVVLRQHQELIAQMALVVAVVEEDTQVLTVETVVTVS